MNSSTTPVAELDGLVLADVLRAGIYRLFEKTDHINKINVFPVPDGDTGTNMSMTLSACKCFRRPSRLRGRSSSS